MADDADMSQDRAEREEALRRRYTEVKPTLPATGKCYNCGEELEGEKRWCDAACRDDWHHRLKGVM